MKEITGEETTPPEHVEETEEPPETSNENKSEITKLIEERLTLYKQAVAKATSENETSRARRFGRGLKTLEGLLSNAHAGQTINEADIPPDLPPSATGEKPPQSEPKEETATPDAPSPPPPEITPMEEDPAPPEETPAVPNETPSSSANIDQESLDLLKKRQHDYKVAAVIWKKSGNLAEAMNNVKIAKQFDVVLAAVAAGETIDLSDMPPPPQLPASEAAEPVPDDTKQESEVQQSSEAPGKIIDLSSDVNHRQSSDS